MIFRFMAIAAPRNAYLREILAQYCERFLVQEPRNVKRTVQHHRLPSRSDKGRIELLIHRFCICLPRGLLQCTPRPAEA